MQNPTTFTLKIHLLDEQKLPHPSLLILAGRLVRNQEEIVDEAITDEAGTCELSITLTDAQIRKGEVFVKILDKNQKLIRREFIHLRKRDTNPKVEIQLPGSTVNPNTGEEPNPDFSLFIEMLTESGYPVPNTTIEAWDYANTGDDDLLGAAITDGEGRCEIGFNRTDIQEKDELKPDVYFKVFEGENLIFDSKETVIYWRLNIPKLDVVLRIPDPIEIPVPAIPVLPVKTGYSLASLSELKVGDKHLYQ
ncbi:MAG: hypothetical protein R3B93_03450 [Bacteroidia bacterium]